MEVLPVSFNDKLFDKLVHSGPPEAGDMQIAVKEKATVGGSPGFVISFTVKIGDTMHRVQAVNTVKNLMTALVMLSAKYPGLCKELGFTVRTDLGNNPNSGQTHPN